MKTDCEISQDQLRFNSSQICRRLNPEPDLFNRLVSNSVLTKRQSSCCQNKTGRYNQSSELLCMLLRRPVEDFKKFCDILEEIGQGHIVTEYLTVQKCDQSQSQQTVDLILSREVSDLSINPAWRNVIRRNLLHIGEALNPDDGLITDLVSSGVIQDHLEDVFKSTPGRTNRSVKILEHLICNCSDEHYSAFLQALARTNQSHALDQYLSEESPPIITQRDVADGPLRLDVRDVVPGDWKRRMVRQHSRLTEKLEPSDELIRELESVSVINSQQREVLLEKVDPYERVDLLLDHMKRRPDVDFIKFCRVLDSLGQGHVVTDCLTLVATTSPVPDSNSTAAVDSECKDVNLSNIDNGRTCSKQCSRVGSNDLDEFTSNKFDKNTTSYPSTSSSLQCEKGSFNHADSPYHNIDIENRNLENKELADTINPFIPGKWYNSSSQLSSGPVEITDVSVFRSTWEFYNENKNKGYPMNARYRGRCVIVNIQRTVGQDEREGSEVDQKLLSQLFSLLHFKVQVHNDLTAQEIRSLMEDLSQDCSLEKDQCLIVFVLSHGERVDTGQGPVDCVYGSDGCYVYNDKDILNKFTQINCPALKGRPKLFFFQACRGRNYDQCDSAKCAVETESSSNFADFLILYPTHSSFCSFRNKSYGSWYVNAIVQVFMRNAHNTGLCGMMNEVNGLVSRWKSWTEDETLRGKTQVAEYTSKLRKTDIFFFPGIIVDEEGH